jgi:hypothetical protein
MGYRLKSRQLQIPNGFKFIQPETGWVAPRFASFNSIAKNLAAHRKSRPDLIAKHSWRTDMEGVEFDLEQFNIRLCLRHGWTDYLEGMEGGGGPLPKSRPPTQSEVEQVSAAAGRAKKIWSGVKTLNDWIDSGDAPVPAKQAGDRAAVCVQCTMNTAGDFTSWFTKPAAGAIKSQIEKLQARKLSTPHDEKLNVCDVCLCPLKLKVHTPLSFIQANMSEAVLSELQKVEKCWIVKEMVAAK